MIDKVSEIKESYNLTDINIQDIIYKFLSSQDVKENSKVSYGRYLKQFLTWIQEENIQQPIREDILRYKDYLKSKELSSYTISSYITGVRKFFEWAQSMGLYPDISTGIKGAKLTRKHKKESLTLPQVKELLSNIDRSTLQGKRDFALINLMIRTGLRTIEVSRINMEDIQQKGGEVILWIQGKGRDDKDEFVILTEETYKPILNYLNIRGHKNQNNPLFTSLSNRNTKERLTTHSISRIVRYYLKRIGVKSDRLTAHSLRHTAITFSLLGGASVQEAMHLARHKNIETTLRYAHNIDRIKNAPERRIDSYIDNLTTKEGKEFIYE